MAKKIQWNVIKADYLAGVTPKDLAKIHKVEINKIYKKIENFKWASELREIKSNIGNDIQNQIKELTNKALKTLESVIDNVESKDNDKVSACKAILDISGLKTQKQEISGSMDTGMQKVFVMPENIKEIDKHIAEILKG